MLEIGFGVQDLAAVRFAISPMDHLLGGVAGVQHHCVRGSLPRERWWRQARSNIPWQAAPLIDLVNASAVTVPDFLAASLTTARPSMTDELDAVLALPESRLVQDLACYDAQPPVPRIVAELREGGRKQLRRITDAAWALFRRCLAPDWPDIQRALQSDIAQRSRTMAEAGTGAVLERLHPSLEWHGEGALRITGPGWEGAFGLGGRGLQIRPSAFLHSPTALLADHWQPVLMIPGRARPARRTDGLSGLIGPTRTRALRAIAQEPCTTGRLAEHLGVTAPTASAHATALRNAGAITTDREGRSVRHSLTPLGHDLLLGAGGA
jgi:DNA-binding transcriptional ArsR family regulator